MLTTLLLPPCLKYYGFRRAFLQSSRDQFSAPDGINELTMS